MTYSEWWARLLRVSCLTLTISGMAHAQSSFECSAAALPRLLRSEGLTELVGDIVLRCTGGVPVANGAAIPSFNVQVFLSNTTITSRLSESNVSDALLMIDEPGSSMYPGPQVLCENSVNGCGPYIAGSAAANVFRGLVTANSVTFIGVPIDPPGGGARVFRITNIRANASAISTSNELPGQLQAFVTVSGATPVPVINQVHVVGFVLRSLAFGARSRNNSGPLDEAGFGINQCGSADRYRVAALRFQERFATAFKARSAAAYVDTETSPTPEPQNMPGTIYLGESGLYNPSVLAGGGVADFGTRLRAVFSNIPAGVGIWVSTVPVQFSGGVPAPNGSDNPQARLIASESGPFAAVPASDVLEGVPAVQLPVVNGMATAVWETLTEHPLSADSLDFPVWVSHAASGAGTVQVGGSIAPAPPAFSISNGAQAQNGVFPLPRFVDTAASINLLNFSPWLSVDAASASIGSGGGTAGIPVTSHVCHWSAASNADWIAIGSPNAGTTSATVQYTVAPYAGPLPRTGTITIAGQTFTVTQRAPIANNETFIRQAYSDLLGREADTGGLSYWLTPLNGGQVSRSQVAAAFFNSPEFSETGLYIIKLYVAVLRRDPDFDGWDYWSNALRSGVAPVTMLNTFLTSEEFQSTYGSLGNADFVTLVYRNVLGRDPDAGGMSYWLGLLNSGAVTRAAMMHGFVVSAEFDAGIRNRAYAMLLYMGFLRRSPEPSGLAYWTDAITNSSLAATVNAFITSQEYMARF